MKTILAFLLTIIVATSHARLGETLDQCSTHYGPVVEKKPDSALVVFEKEGFVITAHFSQGKADCVTYQNKDGAPLTDLDVGIFADANLGKGWSGGGENTSMQPKHGGGIHGMVTKGGAVRFFTKAYWQSILEAGGSIQDLEPPSAASPARASKLF